MAGSPVSREWSAGDAAEQFKKQLKSMNAKGSDSRPRREKTLRATVRACFAKKLAAEQVESVMKELRKGNWLQISPQGAVSYVE